MGTIALVAHHHVLAHHFPPGPPEPGENLILVYSICIHMGVISVRIPDTLQQELDEAGVKIAETVKENLIKLAERLRVDRRNTILAKYRRRASRPVADVVRETREEH